VYRLFLFMENLITAISIQKRNPDRINIHINGAYSFSINRIVGAWLKIGQSISDQKKAELINSDDIERAFQSAAHFISYRSRSEDEVIRNLSKKEFSNPVIEKTVSKLKEAGLVNDEDFAIHWVENRIASKPRSRRMLEYELKQKKVDLDMIRRAVEVLPDESILGLQAAKKRMRQFGDLGLEVFTKKMTSYLLGKGFGYGTAKQVVGQVWEEIVNERKFKISK
jgi:regulatory protein